MAKMDDVWMMGSVAAQDSYNPDERAVLPDVGAPLIGDGGQFSPGVPVVNRVFDKKYVLPLATGAGMGALAAEDNYR